MHDALAFLAPRAHAHAPATGRQRGFDAVHAVKAQHLFVQVNLALQVGTERRHGHAQDALGIPCRNRAPQARKRTRDEVDRDGGPHHLLEALDAKRQHGRRRIRVRPHIYATCAHRAACHLGDERGGVIAARIDAGIVHATLVADGRIAHEPQVAARAARMRRTERRGFEQDVHRALGHFRIQPAHDARKRHRALRRGDDRHIGREHALFPVKRRELLACMGRTHDDARRAVFKVERVEIERMQRLPQLEQHVVGHVHHVVDGTLADGGKAFDQPIGRRPHLHAADEARCVARA